MSTKTQCDVLQDECLELLDKCSRVIILQKSNPEVGLCRKNINTPLSQFCWFNSLQVELFEGKVDDEFEVVEGVGAELERESDGLVIGLDPIFKSR